MSKELISYCCLKHFEEPNVPKHSEHLATSFEEMINPCRALFIVCKICGNKRCPKATDCDLDCTNSNEPGQVGSVYS
jgi:hypothetical protein